MNRTRKSSLALLTALPLLSSCFYLTHGTHISFPGKTQTDSSASMDYKDGDDNFSYQAKSTGDSSNLTLSNIGAGFDYHYLPSTGNSKILVVPIQFQDDSFTQAELSRIQNTFFGDSSDTYWESVSSFYKKSSFGKLNISGTVADPLTYQGTVSEFQTAYNSASKENKVYTDSLLQSALNKQVTKGVDLSSFDSDSDGYIDAVWMVYSSKMDSSEDAWWAYTTWAGLTSSNSSSSVTFSGMKASCYSWASVDFMLEGSNLSSSFLTTNGDAHTFVHETGHMMGLDDYYSYDYDYSKGLYDTPLGGVDMMDFNIGDHNPFSKALLGWKTPFEVTEAYLKANNYKVTLTDFPTTGYSILLPVIHNGTDTYYGNAFAEYLLVDLYTPLGLNSQDTSGYAGNGLATFTNAGIRVTHINSSVGKIVVNSTNDGLVWDGTTYTGIPSADKDNNLGYDHVYYPIFSNTRSRSYAKIKDDTDFYRGRLISLLPATGSKIQGSSHNIKTYAGNSSLYKKGDSFGLKNGAYSDFYFDTGDKPQFGFTVESLSTSTSGASATLVFSQFGE